MSTHAGVTQFRLKAAERIELYEFMRSPATHHKLASYDCGDKQLEAVREELKNPNISMYHLREMQKHLGLKLIKYRKRKPKVKQPKAAPAVAQLAPSQTAELEALRADLAAAHKQLRTLTHTVTLAMRKLNLNLPMDLQLMLSHPYPLRSKVNHSQGELIQ